jgi:hypothetical protein
MPGEVSETVAREIGQQIAQELSQALSQNISELISQTVAKGVSQESKQEEVMGGEAIRSDVVRDAGMRGLNVKAHFDKHIENLNAQAASTARHIEEDRKYLDRLRQENLTEVSQLAFYKQALMKGLVTSDAMITKGKIGVNDVATEAIRETPGGPQDKKA